MIAPYIHRQHVGGIVRQEVDGLPTEILYQSDARYDLAELKVAFPTDLGTSFSRHEVIAFPLQPFSDDVGGTTSLPSDMDPDELVARAEHHRAVLEAWIRRNMQPGLHYGIIPIDGQEASKPTLLKPGAELVALLYQWRFHFTADLDSLQMYGAAGGGAFAYICHVIDREGRTVGQGRGVAELRERDMLNANKTVKMAEKRAMVDAILRCAGLSQWFTQDLEEPPYVSPDPRSAPTSDSIAGKCLPTQVTGIRLWLHRTKKSEREILAHYKIRSLEELSRTVADQLLARLQELSRSPL